MVKVVWYKLIRGLTTRDALEFLKNHCPQLEVERIRIIVVDGEPRSIFDPDWDDHRLNVEMHEGVIERAINFG